jgi:hypothetical protein
MSLSVIVNFSCVNGKLSTCWPNKLTIINSGGLVIRIDLSGKGQNIEIKNAE